MAFDGTLDQLRRGRGADAVGTVASTVLPVAVALAMLVFVVFFPKTTVTLAEWFPLLAQGFGMNVLIGSTAIAAATVIGCLIGVSQTSAHPILSMPAQIYVTIFRNAPYLVVMFAITYVLPFEVRLFGQILPFPDWLKAAVGLTLPATAYTAELVRGAIQSIPPAQWEASAALGFSRPQTLRWIILPQTLRRVLPPWTNLIASVMMSTALAALVGVEELLHTANDASTAVRHTEFTVAIYLVILLWFFLFTYPISRLTQHLEHRFVVY
jgi:polar amino acid transport system permease protein